MISKINSKPHSRRYRRVEIGSQILYAAVTDPGAFDCVSVQADLAALRISLTDIVDQCVPDVARMLGVDWVEDRKSFAAVTSASARLYGLCKTAGQDWDNIRPGLTSRALLLATMDREDHIIGPAVVADQLRRRGHSVQIQLNATALSLQKSVTQDLFDAVLISASSWRTLESATNSIKELRRTGPNVLVVLGGSVLNEDGFDVTSTSADLTTNDIDAALDVITGDDINLRAAE